MGLAFYMDVHIPHPVTAGLLHRDMDVLTAQWDRGDRLPDPALLDRAGSLGRVLVSQDEDLLVEAAVRQAAGLNFAGVVYAHQQRISIRKFIEDLELLSTVLSPSEMLNRVEFLPL